MKLSKKPPASMAQRRLTRDLKNMQNDPPIGSSGAPTDSTLLNWACVIFGPDDSPWEGGIFLIDAHFTEEFPSRPPQVSFKSRIFHPNVYASGEICLDILQNQWSPVYDISSILTSIRSILCGPNPKSPANQEAARLFVENRREYDRRVREGVEASLRDIAPLLDHEDSLAPHE